jgi:alkanesulfonate monooxygenase SsuD/methylene tetrahydromethanopterin reductase-like flavin-dependent oxidoreductase (luciferase family)
VYSAAFVAAGGEDEAEYVRRAEAIGRRPAELRENGLAGTAAEIVDRLGALQNDGVETVYLQILDLRDLEHLEFLAAEVVPELG